MNILIAEDLAQNRLILESYLKHLGHTVIAATDGSEAYDILCKSQINFLITDWVMPKMTGPELCSKIRSEILDRYVYIIIITAHTEAGEVVKALEAGADDFLKKPFHPAELKCRIATGNRILELEKRLEENNARLRKANQDLNRAYAIVKNDIDMAAYLQRELLPDKRKSIEGYAFDWLFMPTSGVAGDIFNFGKTDFGTIDFYQIDVAGHGVASAMLAYTLSKFLGFMQRPVQFNIVEILTDTMDPKRPSYMMDRLNTMFYKENDAMQFFTVCYGSIEPGTGKIFLSRAGHPMPILTRPGSDGHIVNTKGMPVGILKETEFDDEMVILSPGSRIFLYSDGVIDAVNSEGEMFGFDRLNAFLSVNSAKPLREVIEALKQMLIAWKGDEKFEDDISVLAIEKE
ncbi:MAG: SpoIIE family protein phosphatase [Ignavibacteriales bacterium]|nr:SpoIIE family protein phosphatase [Ignavibacteriales bacterium]